MIRFIRSIYRPFTGGAKTESQPTIRLDIGVCIDDCSPDAGFEPSMDRAAIKGKKAKPKISNAKPAKAKKTVKAKASKPVKAAKAKKTAKPVKKAKVAKPAKAVKAAKKSKVAKPVKTKKAAPPKKVSKITKPQSKPATKKVDKKADKKAASKSPALKPKEKAGKEKAAPPSKSVSKAMMLDLQRRVPEGKRRKPRMYSSRSKLSSFLLGDLVVFRRIRDWSDENHFIKMTGKVISKGHDPEIGVNYIEVAFEDVRDKPEESVKNIRRFFVK